MQLRDVAYVQPGYLSRTRVRSALNGTHRLLQARDVSPRGGLRVETAVQFMPERDADLYSVSRGDVLLAARGQDHTAHLVESDLDGVLASSVFYILRPRQELVLPGYLAWWLNQADPQAALEAASSGTGISYIARPAIEHLTVLVTSIDIQRRIADAISLWQSAQSIQACLVSKRAQLIHAVCRQAVQMEKD